MDLQLKDKAVLITGSTKGIGLEIAKTLAAEGSNVGVCARNQSDVAATVTLLEAMGVRAFGEVVDVADETSLTGWVSRAAEYFGGIDGFVSNVSGGGADTSEAGWRANFEVDMLATWKAANAVLPYLQKSSSGSLVVISSTAALEAFAGPAPYGAMKAALLNYSSNLAAEQAPLGVRVNAVSPGPIFMNGGAWDDIKTAMPEIYEGTVAAIPLGRMGAASEVASQVALLISPVAGFTTGANIVIDGSFTKRVQF